MFRRTWRSFIALAAVALPTLGVGAARERPTEAFPTLDPTEEMIRVGGVCVDKYEASIWNTGSNSGCVSALSALDMVGNVWEWVADWLPLSIACPGWGWFSDDTMCLSGASTTGQGPGAPARGGSVIDDALAGPFAVDSRDTPNRQILTIGFRGAR